MKSMMLKMALPIIMGIVEDMITPENFKIYGKKLIDLGREFVQDTDTTIDDKLCLPLLDAAEKALFPSED